MYTPDVELETALSDANHENDLLRGALEIAVQQLLFLNKFSTDQKARISAKAVIDHISEILDNN